MTITRSSTASSRHQPRPHSTANSGGGRLRAVVLGGTGGLGTAICKALLTQGYEVVQVSRRPPRLQERVRALPSGAANVWHVACDVTSGEAIEAAIGQIGEALGDIDVLVHAAGGRFSGGLCDTTPAQWREACDTHLHSVFYACRAVAPAMIRRRAGSILIITSAAGLRTVPDAVAYSTAKAGAIQMVKCIAAELGPHGIRVNAVAPGFIDTPFHSDGPVTLGEIAETRIPLRRVGRPSEVAQLVTAVLRNGYITGGVLVIDGGLNLGVARRVDGLHRDNRDQSS